MPPSSLAIAKDILIFWFGNPDIPGSEYGQQRQVWFRKNCEFDQQIRDRFLPIYEQAREGHYDSWIAAPHTALALIIVLDQFSRNMFRGTGRCFEADAQALKTAGAAIARHHDRQLIPVERIFLYLPFEHSEDLAHQNRSVALFETLIASAPELQSTLDYAYRHRDVIARFGRFPHRNSSLGRSSTPEELDFLRQPGSRF
ncbi:MAG: DUF924 family protein [Cyanobacteria bacterium P01_C01_bin.120]